MKADLVVLGCYAVLGVVVMLFVTDADFDSIRVFIAGAAIAGIGCMLAAMLSTRRDGRE